MTDTVRTILDTNIDKMFTELVAEYDLKYGDIAPEQVDKLDRIKEQLGDLLGDYVYQNIEPKEHSEVTK